MKFTIERQDFIKVLQRMQGIVEKRNTMPILSNVHIEASGQSINITATDLEVFIKDSTSAKVAEEGVATVNARKLFEIIKELPEDKVDISSTKEDKVTIKAGKARFNVMGLPSKDFPQFPVVDEESLNKIDGRVLKEMIEKTSFAVSTDETRYNINGFLFENTKEGGARMVATDGHRLALIEKKDLGAAGFGDQSVLLPKKGANEIKKLLDEKDSVFLLGITQRNAVVKMDKAVISTRLLDGEFPDYKKVIPKDNNKTATLDRATILSSLKRVSILSSDKIKGVRFSFSKSTLTLTSSSPDIGEATEEVDVDYTFEPIEIAFNALYFIDMLEATESEKITIALKDPLSPVLIQPHGSPEYTYIIMPMRL